MHKVSLLLLVLSVAVGGAQTRSTSDAARSPGPRYDVTNSAFGARGDGKTDDTAAIQAAFNACWNNATAGATGGIIEFPGPHSYVISSTIYAYSGCLPEGTIGFTRGAYSLPEVFWNGPSVGKVMTITAFSAGAGPIATPSSPGPLPTQGTSQEMPNYITFTAANTLTAGQWVDIEGLSTPQGMALNHTVAQVAAAGLSSSQFTVGVPFNPGAVSTTSDSGTATTVGVAFAFDISSRYQQSVTNMVVTNAASSPTALGVGFYFGSRVDTGTRIWNSQVVGAALYGFYFSLGGINVDFDKGWRCDGVGIACIYWRVGGVDSFGIANGTTDNHNTHFATSGGLVVLDNKACVNNYGIHFTARNFKMEVNTTLTPGLGVVTMYDCPSAYGQKFDIDAENVWVTPAAQGTAGFNFPSFVLSPPNDSVLSLNIVNGAFPAGTAPNTTVPFVGIPALARYNIADRNGTMPELAYGNSGKSNDFPTSIGNAPVQLLDDVNIGQLWQYGIQASALLYSDTAYAALPNATTLYAGQILAPPAYWNSGNATNKRFALDVVARTGTTGTPNRGATTCVTAAAPYQLMCTSAADLSAGQHISIGSVTDTSISRIDATNPASVLVSTRNGVGTISTPTALRFSPPVLGMEMQLPAKSNSAPAALKWSQGDMEQNSGATVNGVAAWVNVAAGAPGRWAGIPLGDSAGKIAAWQLSDASTVGKGKIVLADRPIVSELTGTGTTTLDNLAIRGRCIGCTGTNVRTAQAFCAGTASSSSTLLLFGAGGAQTACRQAPGPQTLQQVILPTAGTLSNLAVRCGHLGSGPASGRFTVWDLPSGAAMTDAASGRNTGLTVTIGNSPAHANRTLIDTQHTFNYAAGDMIRIQFTTEAGETLADCTASFDY